ncbi:MAG TPA: glycosyltransferase family 39 protein [Rugosimonospora sp.]|nr:glycosyltransferase family 39 protein [Rugosimonospora sp.]
MTSTPIVLDGAAATAAPTAPTAPTGRRWAWLFPPDQPGWARPALFGLAALAGAVYVWGVRLGELHPFYSPAVMSMSRSWRAFFYGAYDPAASITLDKLPGAFQIEALSARLFGFSTWSLLLPQVAETVVAIVVLYGLVRRWLGSTAGLVAAAVFAGTPIVAALAHAEISETAFTLLLILAADALSRALAGGRLRWLLLSGIWVGLAFQTKMVEAWAILPALGIVYLIAAPLPRWRRVRDVALAGLLALGVSMSWIVMVMLTPASARPYIDGTTDNSPLSMVFDYNLLNRYGLNSDSAVQFGGRVPSGGVAFMFADAIASQVGWVYPLALVGLLAGLVRYRRTPRTDPVRAGLLLYGLWLLTFSAAFSTGRVAHSYYVVAVAPAVSALAGGGLVLLWRLGRQGGWVRWLLPATLAGNAGWAVYLARRHPAFLPWLTPVLVGCGVVSLVLVVAILRARGADRRGRVALSSAAGLAVLATLLVAPGAWAVSTDDSRYAGSGGGPAAGPQTSLRAGGTRPGRQAGVARTGVARAGRNADGGFRDRGTGRGVQPTATTLQLIAWLRGHQPGSRYLLATQGSMVAGPYILAGASVLPMGGFSGRVPFPRTDQLAALIATGELRYVLAGGNRDGNTVLTTWVTGHCTPVPAPGAATADLYDCARSG